MTLKIRFVLVLCVFSEVEAGIAGKPAITLPQINEKQCLPELTIYTDIHTYRQFRVTD